MITYSEIPVDNLYTEGFGVTLPGPLSISFAAGTLNLVQNTRETVDGVEVNGTKMLTHNYTAFEFDVVPDIDFTVVYDVYLLEKESPEGYNIHIDRTEMAGQEFPFYTGDTPQIHCLMSLQIPAGTTDLSTIPITIRTVRLIENEGK